MDNELTKTRRSMLIPIHHPDNKIASAPKVYFSLNVELFE